MDPKHKALVDALDSVADVLADPEWVMQCHDMRRTIVEGGRGVVISIVEIALFWQWRSDHWSAGWLMPEPHASVLDWWERWCRTGRLDREHYEA